MAQRRMFSKKIVETDYFMDMSPTAKLLYFYLNMGADDDGFVGNPKMIKTISGASDDDQKILIAKQFIIPFDSGVIVIKDWRIHNYIQKDRYNKTQYTEEMNQLLVEKNGTYTKCIQDVSNMDTQVRLGKVRLGKDRDILLSSSNEQENNDATMSHNGRKNVSQSIEYRDKSIELEINKDKPILSGKKKPDNIPYKEIIDHLNLKAGKNFKHETGSTKTAIRARFKEGFNLDDFIKVIDNMTAKWKGTKQEEYLRPSTLFSPSKFEGYLNADPTQRFGDFNNSKKREAVTPKFLNDDNETRWV